MDFYKIVKYVTVVLFLIGIVVAILNQEDSTKTEPLQKPTQPQSKFNF